jgi:hypothetical protein
MYVVRTEDREYIGVEGGVGKVKAGWNESGKIAPASASSTVIIKEFFESCPTNDSSLYAPGEPSWNDSNDSRPR